MTVNHNVVPILLLVHISGKFYTVSPLFTIVMHSLWYCNGPIMGINNSKTVILRTCTY